MNKRGLALLTLVFVFSGAVVSESFEEMLSYTLYKDRCEEYVCAWIYLCYNGRRRVRVDAIVNAERETLLHIAARTKCAQVVSALLAVGADAMAYDEVCDTPAHLACASYGGYSGKRVLEYLVVHMADINVRNNWGETPLHKAATYGDLDAASFLVSKGASCFLEDCMGLRPWQSAEKAGHHRLAAYLRRPQFRQSRL